MTKKKVDYSVLPRELSYSILFHGIRHSSTNCQVTYSHHNGEWGIYILNPRLDIVNHSPTGFNWGYMGSGPAQLALAILYQTLKTFFPEAKDSTIRRFADLHHQAFKFQFMPEHIKGDNWYLDGKIVLDWMKEKEPMLEKLLLEPG